MKRLVSIHRRVSTGRFHPFIWRWAPLPGEDGSDKLVRYRSQLHHTTGLETLVEAETAARKLADENDMVYIDGVSDDDWAEGEVPARTVFHPSP